MKLNPFVFLTLLLSIVGVGCSLSPRSQVIDATRSAVPTPTPAPAVLDARDNTDSSDADDSGGDTIACTPRADWLTYTVAAGDTVGSIARRTSSTISEIATGNCLADVNTIAVGQVLRVPRVPVAELPDEVAELTYIVPGVFSIAYPADWFVSRVSSGETTSFDLTSFNPAGEVPNLKFAPDEVAMTFTVVGVGIEPGDLNVWTDEVVAEMDTVSLDVTAVEGLTLPSGLPARRITGVSGSGHIINWVLTIVNERNVIVMWEGNLGAANAVVNTLRAT